MSGIVSIVLTTTLLSSLLLTLKVYSDSCMRATSHDAEGPYYTPNAPIRTDFTSMDPKSDKLYISGQVINMDTCQGVYSKIDFWNANSSGVYDNIGYNMRGAFYTDKNGYYSINTRLPGWFAPRPHHIHCKIWIQDINVLTTQLYFSNYGVGGGIPDNELTLTGSTHHGYVASFIFIVDNVPDTIQDTEPPEIGITTTEKSAETVATTIGKSVNNTNYDGMITTTSTTKMEKQTTKIYTTQSISCCTEESSSDQESLDSQQQNDMDTSMEVLAISLSVLGVLLMISIGYVIHKNRKQKSELQRIHSTAQQLDSIGTTLKTEDVGIDDEETATLK